MFAAAAAANDPLHHDRHASVHYGVPWKCLLPQQQQCCDEAVCCCAKAAAVTVVQCSMSKCFHSHLDGNVAAAAAAVGDERAQLSMLVLPSFGLTQMALACCKHQCECLDHTCSRSTALDICTFTPTGRLQQEQQNRSGNGAQLRQHPIKQHQTVNRSTCDKLCTFVNEGHLLLPGNKLCIRLSCCICSSIDCRRIWSGDSTG